jgi:DNA-binding Lrp family transcriptional regulator
MRTSLEERKEQFRIIYEELIKDFRVYKKSLARSLGVNNRTASRRLREAFEKGYISLPQLRKRSYSNFKEYIYFVRCENPLQLFKQYQNDPRIIYHAVINGFANLWIVSRKEIDIPGEIITSGIHSDYHVAHPPNCSWNTAMDNMWEKAKSFHPAQYTPTHIITTHWNEHLDWWDKEFEKLYREFKFNARKKFKPIMKKHCVSSDKIYRLLENINRCCSVIIRYFPEGIKAYDPYLFMFETEYEDFIIELFSQLPTSAFFFRVSGNLCLYAHTKRSSMRKTGLDMSDISELHIPLITEYLLNRGILKRKVYALVEYHWTKSL